MLGTCMAYHFKTPEYGGDFVCQACQRAGKVATISRQKRGKVSAVAMTGSECEQRHSWNTQNRQI